MKKIILMTICAVLVLALSVSVMAEELTAQLVPEKTTVNRGQSIVVTVSIPDYAACKSGSLRLSYDSTVFERSGNQWLLDGLTMNDPNGDAVFAYGSATDISGDIYRFTLKVKSTAAFASSIVSAKLTLRNSSGTATTVNAAVSISVVCDHSYGAWTEKNSDAHIRVCSVCGEQQNEDHDWKGEVTKVNGCDQPGEMTYTCQDCGATKKETIDPTGNHVWDDGEITKEATCAKTGVMTYTCASCGTTYDEDIPVSSEHSYGDWKELNSEKHIRECSVCHKENTASHDWDNGTITKAATCAQTGERTYTCEDCGAHKTEEISKKSSHTFENECDEVCDICGHTRTVSHKYRDSWSSDSSGHWHICTLCGDRKDEAAHTPGPEATEWEAQVCTTCGYVMQSALGHTHHYESTCSADDWGHWYACSGCDEKKDYADHVYFTPCSDTCGICGYVREVEHDYGNRLSYDATGHWHACRSCGDVLEKEPHNPGPEATETEDQICLDCGFVIQTAHTHTHSPNGDLLANASGHWHQCACGEIIDLGEHSWDDGTEDLQAGVCTYLCTVCGYSRIEMLPGGPQIPGQSEPTEPNTNPTEPVQSQQPGQDDQNGEQTPGGIDLLSLDWWWYVIIAICILLIGAAIFVIAGIIAGKKQVGKFTTK